MALVLQDFTVAEGHELSGVMRCRALHQRVVAFAEPF